MAAALVASLVPLASYSVIAWRAFHPAVVQWPVLAPTWKGVLRHITGAQYRMLLGHYGPSEVQRGYLERFVYPFLAPHFERRVDLLTGRPGPGLAPRLRRDGIEFLAVESGGPYAAWARTSGLGFTRFWQGDGVTVLRRPLSSPS